MSKDIIIYKYKTNDWEDRTQELMNKLTKWGLSKKDFVVELKEYSRKTGKQNRGYWKLISIYQRFINSFGNDFTLKEVSNWVKVQAGYCREINGTLVAKSIANCNKSEMQMIIEWLHARGQAKDIKGLYLTTSEYDELLNNYK